MFYFSRSLSRATLTACIFFIAACSKIERAIPESQTEVSDNSPPQAAPQTRIAPAETVQCANKSVKTATQLAETTNPCTSMEAKIQKDALLKIGHLAMTNQMNRIARELTSEDHEELKHFTEEATSKSTPPARQAHLAKMIRAIYNRAIQRAGLHRGMPDDLNDPNRSIVPEPTGESPMGDGMTVVVTSSMKRSQVAPLPGDITDAFLVVGAEPNHYDVVLFQVKTVAAEGRTGFRTEGDYVSMTDYVKSKMAANCTKTASR